MTERRFWLLALMMATVAVKAMAQTVGVYIADKDSYTNVRNAPKGTAVDKIDADSYAMFYVTKPTNGWWLIVDGQYQTPDGDDIRLKGSDAGYWIHSSVIGVGSRNYGGEPLHLRKSPQTTAPVVCTLHEETLLRPLDVKGDWVKVKTPDGHIGWIESDWLCGNSVTNCI